MTANGSEDDTQDGNAGARVGRGAWSDAVRPSVAVVEAVADERDRDPMELPQLNDYVDPDALDKLLASASGDGGPPAHVSFEYDGLRVTVDSTGAVTVED